MSHQERFTQALQHIDSDVLNSEYQAALYILTADKSIWNKASSYVGNHGIDIPTMLREVDLSSGYRVLVQLAGTLFNGQTSVDLNEMCCVLDEAHFNVALMALQMRRYGVQLGTLKSFSFKDER